MNALQAMGPTSPLPTISAPMDIVRAALQTGNIEMYREAVSLAERMDAIAARKAFDNAMADAKAEIPTIRRNREVNSGGRGPSYRFEDLAEIARTIDPILAKHGLNYRFRTNQDGNQISVTCVVSHRAGHFEENTLTAGPDNGPGRNTIQQIGSTQTYLCRYTLKAALGLAASHEDDDGRAAGHDDAGAISDDQLRTLIDLADEVGADKEAFCEYFRIASFADMPAKQFDRAISALNRKKGQSK